jgi:DNA invertase Pin-like site-specific DNA recombinase
MVAKSRACRIVAYLRCSKGSQLLGIDAQEATVKRIAEGRGCEIVRTYVEHESGGNNDRPELDKAIRHARRVKAILLVAKLDRLARDSTFLMRVYDGDVPVMFGDLPEVDGSAASRLLIQMMGNIAEFERRRIGERTREALATLKARGVKLGTPENLTRAARLKGAAAAATRRTMKAVEDMADVAPIASRLRSEGLSLQAIADHLNAEGYATRKGGEWSRVQVKRVLDRLS